MKTICFAGGCFWGVQEFFRRKVGVSKTTVGYANGSTERPTYKQVCTGNTGHTEALLIEYDELQISLAELLNAYWTIVDPTVRNRQGPDVGTQYRTGIYYLEEADLAVITASVQAEQERLARPIVTEVQPLRAFFEAEEYHQDYLRKHPNGYCHIKLS